MIQKLKYKEISFWKMEALMYILHQVTSFLDDVMLWPKGKLCDVFGSTFSDDEDIMFPIAS